MPNGVLYLNGGDVAWPISALLIASILCYTAWCIAERWLMSHQIHQQLVNSIEKLTSELDVLRVHHHEVTDNAQLLCESLMRKIVRLESSGIDVQAKLEDLGPVGDVAKRFGNLLDNVERQSVRITEVDNRHKDAAVQLLATIREGLDKVTTAQAAVYQQSNVGMGPRRKFQP